MQSEVQPEGLSEVARRAVEVSPGDIGIPLRGNPLVSEADISPFRGNLWGALHVSPERGGGAKRRRGSPVGAIINRPRRGSCKFPLERPPRGLPTVLLRTTFGAQQARSGGEPVEENAFTLMSFHGVDRNHSSVGTRDVALEHRRWLEFGLGTNAERDAPIRQGEGVSRASSQAAYPSFPPKGEKLAHSAAPPFPTEPACAGLRRGPRLGTRRFQRTKGLLACLSPYSFFTKRKSMPPEGVPL